MKKTATLVWLKSHRIQNNKQTSSLLGFIQSKNTKRKNTSKKMVWSKKMVFTHFAHPKKKTFAQRVWRLRRVYDAADELSLTGEARVSLEFQTFL